jgi:hypothetical protein
VRARAALKQLTGETADQSSGIAIVHRALAAPLRYGRSSRTPGSTPRPSLTPWNKEAEAMATTPHSARTAI